jgi:hypothetical protein
VTQPVVIVQKGHGWVIVVQAPAQLVSVTVGSCGVTQVVEATHTPRQHWLIV